jgi:hypothetical protein
VEYAESPLDVVGSPAMTELPVDEKLSGSAPDDDANTGLDIHSIGNEKNKIILLNRHKQGHGPGQPAGHRFAAPGPDAAIPRSGHRSPWAGPRRYPIIVADIAR